jgi:threonine dehydrogenase-like Zn-dependent dehydrogenase
MKAAITDGKGNVWCQDVPMPQPNDYQCLCKMLAAATCTGTDQKHIKNALPWKQQYPGVLGHESVGRVIEVGKKVRYIKPGDVFLRPTAVYNGQKLGEFTSLWGGFAEYGLVTDTEAWLQDEPTWQPHGYMQFQQKLPSDILMSAADATMLITLKETASFAASVGVRLFQSVAILGAGSVGLCMCRFAKVFGAEPLIVVARRDIQLEYARRIGADFTVNAATTDMVQEVQRLTGGRGVDIVLDTTGDIRFLQTTVPMLAPEGRIAPYATYEFGTVVQEHIPEKLLAAGATGEVAAHEYVLDAVRLGLVRLSDYYSHHMPLSEVKRGFELLHEKTAFKVVFDMED